MTAPQILHPRHRGARRIRAAAVAGLVLAILALGAARAEATLYRWTEPDGTAHYTTDAASIPAEARAGATVVEHPVAREPAPPAEPAVPLTAATPLVVDARLNGVPLRLLIDTGADRTLISPAALTRAGLVLAGPPVRIIGVTGTVDATLITVPLLEVAGVQMGPLAVVAHTLPSADFDGLLGRDILQAFTVTVDPDTQRPMLTPR